MAKITRATFKAFVNKNRDKLMIRCESSFSGMSDSVETVRDAQFKPAEVSERFSENTLGIPGVWLVGNSHDYFKEFRDDNFQGIHVYNCCGSFTVAVRN